MNARLTTILALGLLVACSNKPAPEQQAGEPHDATASDAATVAGEGNATALPSSLPGGARVSFPFHLASDRISADKKGRMKRRVVMEIIEGDVGADFESAKQSLLTAGYRPSGKHKGDASKKQSQKFKKKGAPTLYLTSNTSAGKKPANPGAKGVVYFDWFVADMGKAPPVAPAH